MIQASLSSPVGPEFQGQGEGLDGVLPPGGSSAPVGEPDGVADPGREWMHASMVVDGRGRVANSTGSASSTARSGLKRRRRTDHESQAKP